MSGPGKTCQEAISIVQMRYGGDGSGDRENRFDKYVWGKVGGIGKTFTKWGRDSQQKRGIKKSLKFLFPELGNDLCNIQHFRQQGKAG